MKGRESSAFSMIELIFMIIMLGILAAFAIPKLSATRDDAMLSTDIWNMATCIEDAAAWYTARGTDLSAGDSKSCNAVKCYNITYSTGGAGFTVATNPSAATFCSDIDSVGGHLAKTYLFRGSRISF
ncbi:MAG: hypothetical protein B5M52_00185 [Helicobacteraceae bacterium 4484_230]|nr:MAG: hypothetical protein B5M52_00185 [Helicobacteraceae bacterium 4484_230]